MEIFVAISFGSSYAIAKGFNLIKAGTCFKSEKCELLVFELITLFGA